ncbi:MAG TPA: hypothetical protein VFL55_02595, partial [Acetobacteraceae bacterium]|nr:hypothetical protein [Acetobacteraceae bacterium]
MQRTGSVRMLDCVVDRRSQAEIVGGEKCHQCYVNKSLTLVNQISHARPLSLNNRNIIRGITMSGWRERLARTAQRNRQEIVKARLTRRDMMQLGLLTATGGLVAKQGLSARWAYADGLDSPPSPPATPFIQELPIIPQLVDKPANQLTAGSPGSAVITPVDGTSPIDGGVHRVYQLLFKVDAKGNFSGTFPPQRFYQLFMKDGSVRLNDPNPAFGATTVWGFSPTIDPKVPPLVPGPLIKATYGEPIIVRYQNNLPSVNKPAPGGFGIAEFSIHLHNGHVATESDGYPLDYINSSFDPGPILIDQKTGKPVIDPATGKPQLSNPLGFKDCHYPNVYAGYVKLGNATSNSIATPAGDPTESMGSLWYHDHTLDFTAQNVSPSMPSRSNRSNTSWKSLSSTKSLKKIGMSNGPLGSPILAFGS